MKTMLKKIIILTMCLFFLCAVPVCADETDSDTEIIHSRFYTVTTGHNYDLEVRFNKDWFKQDATQYSHDLAKLSLGLATSAFRPIRGQTEEEFAKTDKNLNSFLSEAHFIGLRSDDYDKNPSMYTVSTVMGHQQIGEGDEAFELIAVGVCGQGYVDEWESNFTIGSGKYHEGFLRSANLVYDRIFGYIASQHLEGPYKIWISGFSRAAAVTNLTAAMLSESGSFSQETVYAYTYGTPRTVVDPDYARYKNIFNIVGKADPVPNVPFADWGYERYGTTLYLPVLETDSDFEAKRQKANVLYKEITGIDYWYNASANNTVRTILSYLLEICPSAKIYSQSLQGKLIHIWENRDPVNVMRSLLDMANDPVLINEENKTEANALLNYMLLLISDFSTEDTLFRRWNTSASTTANIAQSHTPEVYVSWLFSTESGEELYNESTDYSIVYIESTVDVELLRDGKVIETLPAVYEMNDEGMTVKKKDKPKVPENNVYMDYVEDQVRALIPGDENYTLRFKAQDSDAFASMLEIYYFIGHFSDNDLILYSYDIPKGDTFSAIYTNTGENKFDTELPFDDDRFYLDETEMSSTSFMIDVTRSRINEIYWRDWVIIIISIIIAFIAVILFQTTYFIGKLRFKRKVKKGWIQEGTRYRVLPYICVFTIFLLFLIMEFFSALFPESKNVLYIFKAAIGILSILMALTGYLRRKKRLTGFVLIGLCILAVADVTMTYRTAIGAGLHIAAYLFLSYAFIREDTPDKKQIIAWILSSALGILILSRIDGEYGVLRIMAMIYLSAALLMMCTSFVLPRRVFNGTLLLFASGIMVMYNTINGRTFLSHIISLGTYYAAIATLASTNTRIIMPKLVPEAVEEELQ